MSEHYLNRLLWPVGLVASGILILLFNFDVLNEERLLFRYVVAGVLSAGGLTFFAAFFVARQHWWRLIPAWTLLALAGMLYLNTLGVVNPTVIAALLFVGLALSFAHVYLLNRTVHWWALIPGGFLLVLSIVIALSTFLPLSILGALLFSGMGVVFYLVYLLGDRRQQWWALIPGAILLIFGLFVLFEGSDQSNALIRWWPLLLIGAGLLFGWQETRRVQRAHRSEKLMIHVAPSTYRPVDSPQRGSLGDYSAPAPGASVEVLADQDD